LNAGLEPGVAPFTARGWWDPADRTYASLRAVNEVRLQILRGWLAELGAAARVVADLGCGGGLMAVPLAQAGARVLGVDRSRPALAAAAAQRQRGAAFVAGDVAAAPLRAAGADLVLLCDVLEHVADPAAAVAEAARLLRPDGLLFVNTINRTLRARLLAVVLAEGLRLIPRGTHDPARFVRPAELAAMTRSAGLRAERWRGERPRLWASLRARAVRVRPGRSLAVGYCALFRKPAP
jgi:2-polyprenyl-6-hydroxyphenyl methylase/3-demethylubiquinone-9 3-methyltransferase